MASASSPASTATNTTSTTMEQNCSSCGVQTHERFQIKSGFLKKLRKKAELRPLTIPGLVLQGRCLVCRPFQEEKAPLLSETPTSKSNTGSGNDNNNALAEDNGSNTQQQRDLVPNLQPFPQTQQPSQTQEATNVSNTHLVLVSSDQENEEMHDTQEEKLSTASPPTTKNVSKPSSLKRALVESQNSKESNNNSKESNNNSNDNSKQSKTERPEQQPSLSPSPPPPVLEVSVSEQHSQQGDVQHLNNSYNNMHDSGRNKNSANNKRTCGAGGGETNRPHELETSVHEQVASEQFREQIQAFSNNEISRRNSGGFAGETTNSHPQQHHEQLETSVHEQVASEKFREQIQSFQETRVSLSSLANAKEGGKPKGPHKEEPEANAAPLARSGSTDDEFEPNSATAATEITNENTGGSAGDLAANVTSASHPVAPKAPAAVTADESNNNDDDADAAPEITLPFAPTIDVPEDRPDHPTQWPRPWPLNNEGADEAASSSSSSEEEHSKNAKDAGNKDHDYSESEGFPSEDEDESSFMDTSSLRYSMQDNASMREDPSLRSLGMSPRRRSLMMGSRASSKQMMESFDSQTDLTSLDVVSEHPLSASNKAMAETLGAGLEAFATKAETSSDFRAEVAQKDGLVAVMPALELNKRNAKVQLHGCSALRSFSKDHGALIAKQGGVLALVTAIKHHGQLDARVLENATEALAYVMVSDADIIAAAKKRAVSLILTAMQKHIDNSTAIQQSCLALLRLSSQSDCADGIVHPKHKGIHTVVQSMKKHPGNLQLQQYACGVLKNLAEQKESFHARIVEEEGVLALEAAMNRHLSNPILQQQALWALYEISLTENIRDEGAIRAAIRAMETHSEDDKVQQYGCGILKNLSVTKKTIYLVAKLWGIPVILSAMRTFVGNAALQRCACGALKHLALRSTNEVAIASQGGIAAVVGAMEEHKLDGTVQREACGALRNLSLQEESKAFIAKYGGVPAILAAMKHNMHDVYLQQQACGTLLNLSSDAELRKAITRLQGVIAVITISKQHVADAKVQRSSFGTLKNLALAPATKKDIVNNDGIDAIIGGMKRLGDEPKVQAYACGALKNLASTSEYRKMIAQQEGIVAIIAAMKQNEKDSSVQQEACGALLHLSKGEKDIITCIAKNGGVTCIVNAMRQHVKSSSVQSAAITSLWNLSTSSPNQALIFEESGISLIISAMKGHLTVPIVQQKACLALYNMTTTEIYRSSVAENGGIDAAVAAMRCHVKDVQLQKYACRFLVSMLQLGGAHKPSLSKGASAVRIALQFHGDNADLKKYAVKFLAAAPVDEGTDLGVRTNTMVDV